MASVSVKLFATVREAAGVASVEAEASTLSELISDLESRFGSAFAKIIEKSGPGREGVVFLINGRNTGQAQPEDVWLSDGDEVAIFPPVSGG